MVSLPMDPRMDALRERLIAGIRRGAVRDERVLEAMRGVPREEFVPQSLRERAYEDDALSIGSGQTISQPYVVALMLQIAKLDANARVLEIGTGSGYAAAVLSRLASEVYTVERHPLLFEIAKERLLSLGYTNVHCRLGDGNAGWPEEAPFPAILAAAATDVPPEPLLEQLEVGGRLIIPIGPDLFHQRLLRIVRSSASQYATEDFGPVSFVPLLRG